MDESARMIFLTFDDLLLLLAMRSLLADPLPRDLLLLDDAALDDALPEDGLLLLLDALLADLLTALLPIKLT